MFFHTTTPDQDGAEAILRMTIFKFYDSRGTLEWPDITDFRNPRNKTVDKIQVTVPCESLNYPACRHTSYFPLPNDTLNQDISSNSALSLVEKVTGRHQNLNRPQCRQLLISEKDKFQVAGAVSF